MRNVIFLLLILVFVVGGCSNAKSNVDASSANLANDQEAKCNSCDDFNPCTQDLCSEETNFTCQHIGLSGEQAGCMTSGCEARSCNEGFCEKDLIPNCCGNFKCEEGESYSTCSKDCELTKEECKKFKEEGESFVFETYHPDCKNEQLLLCRNLAYRKCENYDFGNCIKNDIDVEYRLGSYGGICLLNMALQYKDSDLCEHIFQEEDYDEYWYCKAVLQYGKSACSNIDSNYWLQQCLEDTSQ